MNLETNLQMFTGTEQYYRFNPLFPNVLLTDGAKYLADKASCYWLMDIVASLKSIKECQEESFLACNFKLNGEGGGVFTADDGNGNILYSQELEFTDFPLSEVGLYFIDNIILLPSEY